MKKRSRFLAGMLTMALLFGTAGSAYAAYQKQATLNYNSIRITLDGQPLIPKDAAGQTVEPFIIDGTTYLPVRAVGQALGLGVDWDGHTNTVILTSPEDPWADYAIHDCYADFSVPSFENIVGPNALVDVYPLTTRDSVAYTYDPLKFDYDPDGNCFEDYFDLLNFYGFEYDSSENDVVYYSSKISGITVAMYWTEDNYFSVLLMNV